MTDSGANIRSATPQDIGALSALAGRTFRDTYSAEENAADIEEYIAATFSPRALSAEIEHPDSSVLLACVRERLAGYAILRAGPAPDFLGAASSLELLRLYVERERIGSGVGSALMRACIEEHSRRRSLLMWLGVWNRNPTAIRFYEKWGFKLAGTHRFMLGERAYEDLVMVRHSDTLDSRSL